MGSMWLTVTRLLVVSSKNRSTIEGGGDVTDLDVTDLSPFRERAAQK